jgi:hypothetical protein
MSTQAAVHSIEALKEFRVALALFAEDVLAALGAVDMEIRRTALWLQQDRRTYWQEQIKRRKEQVAEANAEVFRRKLQQRPDYTPAYSEQKELLRRAEISLRDAERRAALVKKWEPALQQAILEYHGTTRRIKDLASGDVPRAIVALERMIEALEAYLREAPPSGLAALESIAETVLSDDAGLAVTPAPSAPTADIPEVEETSNLVPESPADPDEPEAPV